METIMWNLKTILQARLSSEQRFRPDATAQTEVTMGDITESRPVNVSFSFFYINSLPISNWNMTPSVLFLSKHIDAHACAHIRSHIQMYSRRQACMYTSRGIMGTSGGAHPMHRQTFPGEHQKNHQRGFKQPATVNTNTHTHIHTQTDTNM